MGGGGGQSLITQIWIFFESGKLPVVRCLETRTYGSLRFYLEPDMSKKALKKPKKSKKKSKKRQKTFIKTQRRTSR